MPTCSQQTKMRCWLLPFLAVVIAALAAILLGTTASATAAVGTETRVGAFNVAVAPFVGSPGHVSVGQHLGRAEDSVETVVATGVAANAGEDVVRALSASERRTLDDALRPDKLDHIFDPKHKFDPLVQQFGSREAAMEQIIRSIGGPLPQAGRFKIAQSVGGQTVIIRGAVVDGVPRIGTAFTP